MTESAAAGYDALLRAALAEDIGDGDITTNAVIPAGTTAAAEMIMRQRGVLAGLGIALRTFLLLDDHIHIERCAEDGARVEAGIAVARISGTARGILTAERVALNLLGRLCGIATTTRSYVDETFGFPAKISDTRKTTPGLRALERYAVRAGGGVNHRFGLHNTVLIKDNHLAAVGSVGEAVARARAGAPPNAIIEVECERLEQVRDAVEAGVDAILLDNMDNDDIDAAVKAARGRAIVEASGGIDLRTVRDVAATGVDVISVGALTHGAISLDVALDFVPSPVR